MNLIAAIENLLPDRLATLDGCTAVRVLGGFFWKGMAKSLCIERATCRPRSCPHSLSNCVTSAQPPRSIPLQLRDGDFLGEVFSCPRWGTLLVAAGCFDASHGPAATSCKAEALLRASVALARSDWYVLLDDDAYVRLPLMTAFLGRYNPAEKLAFGMKSCVGEGAEESGVAPCALRFAKSEAYAQMVSAAATSGGAAAAVAPRCYPVFAAMSAALMSAMSHGLAAGFLSRSSRQHRLYHDTALGILIWASGATENHALGYPFSTAADLCFEADLSAGSVRDRDGFACLLAHVGSAKKPPEFSRLVFEGAEQSPAGWEERVRRRAYAPDALCSGTASAANGTAPYETLLAAAEADGRVREYLEQCLGLDRPAFRIAHPNATVGVVGGPGGYKLPEHPQTRAGGATNGDGPVVVATPPSFPAVKRPLPHGGFVPGKKMRRGSR